MKATKLPSGSWRVLVYSHTENGKRIYESFTEPTKADAELKASEFKAKKHRIKRADLTLADALEGYIKAKDGVLSPSTLREYRRARKNDYHSIEQKKIKKLTSEDLQLWVSEMSKRLSPKTVRNRYALLTACIGLYAPDMVFKVTLPAKQVKRSESPSDEAVRMLYNKASDRLKPCIALAMCGLRRGEIAALKYEDIQGNIAHVHADIIQGRDREWIYKEIPKTDGSDRFVRLPDSVLDVIGTGKGFIVTELNPNSITQAFNRLNTRLGLHVKLHDLRHYYASIGAILGIPDVYMADMGGWRHDSSVMKAIYQNKITSMEEYYSKKMNEHLDRVIK